MVAKLQIPAYDSVTVVEDVVNERTHFKDFYTAIKGDWKAAVLNYIENSANPQIVRPLDIQSYLSQQDIDAEGQKEAKKNESNDPKIRLADKRKNTLIGLYSPKRNKKPYEILEELRREHGLLYCPSCGETGKPGTLDHYLPKSEFPELSVVIANLTPMCAECQQSKSNDYTNENGDKIFIHPYFDAVEEPIIKLSISPPFNSPKKFEIDVINDIEEPLKSLALRHIAGVGLKERFEEFCRLAYFNLLPIFNDERKESEPEKAERIIKRFLRLAERQSLNRWEAIFYRGVLTNVELLDYLDNGDLPDYI